jgi:hypothetical protein
MVAVMITIAVVVTVVAVVAVFGALKVAVQVLNFSAATVIVAKLCVAPFIVCVFAPGMQG